MILLGDFLQRRLCDETLRHAFDQGRVTDGPNLQPEDLLSAYAFLIKDRLYYMKKDFQTKEETT